MKKNNFLKFENSKYYKIIIRYVIVVKGNISIFRNKFPILPTVDKSLKKITDIFNTKLFLKIIKIEKIIKIN